MLGIHRTELPCFRDNTNETQPVIQLQPNVIQPVTITHTPRPKSKVEPTFQSSGDEIEEIQPVQANVLLPISITHTSRPKSKVEPTFQSSGDEIEEIQPVQANVLLPISITHTSRPKSKVEPTFQSSGDEIEEIQPVQASVLQPISITHTPSPKLKVEPTFQSSGATPDKLALQTTNETSNSLQCFKDSTKETRPVIKLQPNVLQSVTITHRATTSNKLALHKCKLNTTKPDSSSTHHCKYCDKI